jgi:hypothetical protein
MKVIINELERYEIDFPTGDITLEDFKTLVKKLNVVVSTFTTGITSAKKISQGKKQPIPLNKGREDIISLLKDAFALGPNPPEHELDEVLKKHNVGKPTYSKFRWKWIDTYQLTPQDLGLEEFPEKQTGRPPSS